ncbi:MAG: homoserine O-acetyltransferase [Ginsengibacter sp.]
MVESLKIFRYNSSFQLESGIKIPGFHLGYTTYGNLNAAKDNVVWIFHALTANSKAEEWWPGLVGEGKLFDPKDYFIICVNMPGSCYGSTGPLDINPATGEPYYHNFPFFTPRDMIRSYQFLKVELGIKKIKIGIGGSMGGQQCIEWAIEEPEVFDFIFPLATNAFHSAWGIAFNASQRMSIEATESWGEKQPDAGIEGMKVARSIALISYRHYETYHASQSEDTNGHLENFKPESYQRYQGEKLAKRFNAFSYYFLSKGMDAHNVGRGRGKAEKALSLIKAKTLVIGITTDILFPLNEQKFIAENIPNAEFKAIDSLYGHDGFLLEFEQIQKLISSFISDQSVPTQALQIK